jgi:hypothetical protein
LAELIKIINNFAPKDNIQAVHKLSNSDKLIIDKASEGCTEEDLKLIGKFFKSKGYEEDDWVIISPSPDINHKNHIFIDTFFYVIKEWYNGELGEFTESVFGSNGSDLKPITTNKEYFPYTNEQILELYTAKKDYMFMSYNKRPSEHRIWFVNKLFETKLIEKGLVSFLATKDMVMDPNNRPAPILFESVSDLSDKFLDNIPLTIDMNYDASPVGTKQKFYDPHYYDSIYYYRNNYTIPFENIKKCFFNVVTETDFPGKPVKLSEKIYKGIALSPIITFSSPFTLKRLREHGFKTFPMFFDESYDEIIDVNKRVEKVFSEIEKVCNLPLTVLENKYIDALDIVKHNQQILLNAPCFMDVMKEQLNVQS